MGIEEGYYRARTGPGGPWVPVRIWFEQTRDEDTFILSPKEWKAKWAPSTDKTEWYEIDPLELSGWDMPRWSWFRRITKEEYEWLIVLKTL